LGTEVDSDTPHLNGAFTILNEPNLAVKYQGKDSKKFISNVKFSADGTTLAVCSENVVYLYNTDDWASKVKKNSFDVVALNRNRAGTVLVTGDQFGHIRVYKYPCLPSANLSHQYHGHSGRISHVEFTMDDQYVMTSGQDDRCLFQWRVEMEVHEPTPPEFEYHATSDDEMEDTTMPPEQLEMDWIYGYRSHDSRNNLKYTKQGKIVYPVAKVVVVFDAKGWSQKHFKQHQDEVLCLAVHPTLDVVASGEGGKYPAIHVWQVQALHVLSTLRGTHKRGVVELAAVLELSLSDGSVQWSVEMHWKGHIHALAIHPLKDKAITGGDDATLRLWDLHRHRCVLKFTLETASRAVAYSPEGAYVAVGLGGNPRKNRHKKDGTVLIYEEKVVDGAVQLGYLID
ncbi:hypothetical protein DYB36_003246, partial [Aphanomyces astaci]